MQVGFVEVVAACSTGVQRLIHDAGGIETDREMEIEHADVFRQRAVHCGQLRLRIRRGARLYGSLE